MGNDPTHEGHGLAKETGEPASIIIRKILRKRPKIVLDPYTGGWERLKADPRIVYADISTVI